jgi:hypothetical protein
MGENSEFRIQNSEGRREKGEGRREKGEGRREKGEGRREKGEGSVLWGVSTPTRHCEESATKQSRFRQCHRTRDGNEIAASLGDSLLAMTGREANRKCQLRNLIEITLPSQIANVVYWPLVSEFIVAI